MAPFLAEDVEWTISGPVDLLPFCGNYRGKRAVLDLVDHRMPAVFTVFSIVLDRMLVEDQRAATLHRVSARNADGRVISYRVAHFFHFKDGKLTENLTLIDSFDAVEQVLGYSLSVPDAPALVDGDEVVAV
jgi:ketosteroid isomerase-like protein